MASFTDAISQFNPYVQQLPVELMGKVGMQKQAQYDAGVQKAQSYVDNVAGLDVGNDVNKQYLQSKLSALNDNLKVFSAGDFSNQQLVNSIGGLTGELINDKIIQQSVMASQQYKKGVSQLDQDISKGKAKNHTTWLFSKNAEEWLNSKDPGTPFNYRYQTPTADPDKKALEAIKALHPNLQHMQDPFEIINGMRTGKLASVLKEYKVEGLTENRIAQAISASLDANDIQDLQIQGMYRFRDIDSSILAKSATENYMFEKTNAEQELKLLKEQKAISTRNQGLSNELTTRIKYYEKLLGDNGKLATDLKDDLSQISTNPDAAKGDIYKKGFINSYANAFKWSSVSESFLNSPFQQVKQFEETLAFDKQKESNRRADSYRDFLLEKRKQDWTEKIYKDENPDNPWVPVGLDATNKRDAVNVYESIMNDELDDAKGALANLSDAGYTQSQITKMVDDYKKYGNKAKIEPDAIASVQQYLRSSSQFQTLNDNLTSYKKRAEAKALADNPEWIGEKNIPIYNPITRKVENNSVDLLHQIETGKAKVQVDAAPAGYIRLTFTKPDGSKGQYEIKKSEGGAQYVGADKLRPLLLGIVQKQKIYGENLSDMLAPYATELTGRVKAVGDKTGNIPAYVQTNLASYLYSTKQQGIAANSDYSPDVAAQLLDAKNVKDTRVMLYNVGNDYEVIMSSLTGVAPDQKIRLTPQQAHSLFGEKYVENNARDVKMANLAKDKKSIMNNPENALMQVQFGDFPNLEKLQVTANLKEDTGNKGLYIPVVNVLKKDGTYEPFSIAGRNLKQRLGYNQGKEKLNSLTDSQLLNLIKENYPNYNINLLDID